ncbi:MAG: RluA family pseudouridine synthase [Magnetococcales bacterium]|nr:RluA family pseudouridine synthase [Magnetococcales bacterium]
MEADEEEGSRFRLCIPETLSGERVDKALARCAPHLSRSQIQRLLSAQAVMQQAAAAQPEESAWQPLRSDNEKVKAGQWFELTIPLPVPLQVEAENIPLSIVYEDKHLLVVNKAAGMTVHPGAGPEGWRGTLVNALLYHCRDGLSGIGGVARPGIVHRLDKETSGLLVVAKNDQAHHHLSSQFAVHSSDRRYLALVKGVPEVNGRIEAPIGRHPRERQKMAVVNGGRAAITHFQRLETWAGCSLLACRLETGRTHQIRVHLAHRGFPLLGDPLYSRPFTPPQRWPEAARQVVGGFARQALHAAMLGFTHPHSGQRLQFTADPPPDMQQLLQMLRSLA